MLLNKKGMEKPIEIFVALFVILAVALLVLQLFQSQLSDQQQELSQAARTRQAEETRAQARSYCQDACRQAESAGCSSRAIATFCLAYATDTINEPSFLDLNADGVEGLDTTTLVGEGICEDEVPCHTLMSNCCGQQISPVSCKNHIITYWNSQNHNDERQAQLMENLIRPGNCYPNDVDAADVTHWFDPYCAFMVEHNPEFNHERCSVAAQALI